LRRSSRLLGQFVEFGRAVRGKSKLRVLAPWESSIRVLFAERFGWEAREQDENTSLAQSGRSAPNLAQRLSRTHRSRCAHQTRQSLRARGSPSACRISETPIERPSREVRLSDLRVAVSAQTGFQGMVYLLRSEGSSLDRRLSRTHRSCYAHQTWQSLRSRASSPACRISETPIERPSRAVRLKIAG
jgi:hypothetical protein